ncbi:MAG: hypothetical protein AAF798_02240 [Bacteroidota bacterium]
MNVKNIFFLLFALFFLASCSPKLSPFTQELYNGSEWKEEDLKKIQFYLSDDIVLRRQISDGSSEIISGEIKIVNGKEVEEVVIEEGTPGILLFMPKKNRFAISFEDSDARYLVFGPNPRASNRYVLMASEWNRKSGIVTYEEKKYRVDSQSAFSTLMVDLEKIRKVDVNSRRAEGRRVDE